MADEPGTALGDLRVLDLADGKGVYCAKLLADMGADVIKVEPPGGDHTRRLGPFYGDVPDPEKSIFFWHFNTNRRSITLNIEHPGGQALFKRLIASADVLLETFPPGYLDGLGLGFATLHDLNTRLIVTSITDFGQTGPYKDYRGSDLIGLAMGGQLYLCGFPDAAPVRLGGHQAWQQASLHAAYSTLMALYYRDMTGEGQQVDVSVQAAVAADLQNTMVNYDLNGTIRERVGSRLLPCKNGHIRISPGRGWDELVEWMESEGMAGDLKDPRWQDPVVRRNEEEHFNELLGQFLLNHTKPEIFAEAIRRRIPITPSSSSAELLEDPHLQARGYWTTVEHPELGRSFTYPGPPYRHSETPWRIRRRAPLIGEDNKEIYCGEMHLTERELASLQERGIV